MRIRTIPYAAAASIAATLLLSGSASAAPDDRDPVPPGATVTVCSADGVEITAPMIMQDGVELRGDWTPALPGTPAEPDVRCEVLAIPPTEMCRVGAPAEPGTRSPVPARPVEPGTRVERGFTCEGAGVVQSVPRR